MSLALASHVHAAVIGDDVVLLDVARDAYLCVPEGLHTLGLHRDLRTLSLADSAAAQDLLAADLISVDIDPTSLPAPPPTPAFGIGAQSTALGHGDRRRLLGALYDFAAYYRGRSFADILAFAARGQPAEPSPDKEEVLRLARVFQQAAIWLPIPGQCLARSFVLLRFLQRSGLSARWVFGVQTWPFAAHCWLQFAACALDDAPERIALYEPILAI